MRGTIRFSGPALALMLVLGCAAPARAAAQADFTVNTVIELDAPLAPGDYAWDTSGAPPGRIAIVVDLAAERLYVYRGGVEIGRATILFGADDMPTPTGVFPILQKDADHYSSTYDGAPMPYTLRLTWGGVAIHGTLVEDGYATHGCVGVPEPFAALLFSQARLGDRVLITRHWLPEVYGG